MKKLIRTTTLLTVAAAFASSAALADPGHNSRGHDHRYGHKDAPAQNVIRVHIPIRDHGPESLKLGRLIQRQQNLNLDHYRLKAVVVKNGRFSNGYASLRVGDRRTGRYFLPNRENIRIPAPGRAADHWRLRLGPGAHVRAITAVLEPRPYRWAHGRSHYRGGRGEFRRVDDSMIARGWLLNQDDYKRSKKQQRRLKSTRRELARTEAELARTKDRLQRSRQRNQRLNHRPDNPEEKVAQREERHDRQRDRSDRKARVENRDRDPGRYADNQPGTIQRHQQNRPT